MKKSVRLRAIFAELRSAGVEASAQDMLRIAHYIIQTFGADGEEIDAPDAPLDARRFFALPVDDAMRDGGWKVLEFEERRQIEADDLSPESHAFLINRMRKIFGPSWQLQQLQD